MCQAATYLFSEVSLESTFCYNTLTNAGKTFAPKPGARIGHGVCILSGFIYTIGDSTTSDQNARVLSSVHRFDPAANLWSTVAPILSPRIAFASFVLGGSTCVAGGFDGDDDLSSSL
jgi:N-acetylneuraminic acid mutarotase